MPTYKIVIEKRAERELRRLPTPTAARINSAIAALATNPRPQGARKLAGPSEAWRIRIGDYRVLYEIKDQLLRVLVVRVAHRRDVYR